jgi:putative ABC transport system permease protein
MRVASTNRTMFWRIVRRLLVANRARLCVLLLALAAAATITAALLNLQIDARRRLTTEFRAFGPNVVISTRDSSDGFKLLDESLFARVPQRAPAGEVSKAAFLYGVVDVSAINTSLNNQASTKTKAMLVGYTHSDEHPERVISPVLVDYEQKKIFLSSLRCAIGDKLASTLKLGDPAAVEISGGGLRRTYYAISLPPTGGPEDSQIFIYLDVAQELLGRPKSVSSIQINVPGTPREIQAFADGLQTEFPDATGRPIRQFTEAEANIYNRISGLLSATVALVLVLTALCVMAGMTNAAMERKNDVGLMKAIGGATRRVLRLFIAEAALLGLIGGVIGAAAGILLSIWLGQAVFGVAARPRLIVYPVAVILTVMVAIAGALPLRRLATIRPASVFRGE